jgi:hypothetical protein
MTVYRRCRRPAHRRFVPALAAAGVLIAALAPPSRAARTVREEAVEERYPHGDYGFYAGWYDPWDAQFDEHASSAWPIGGKVRFRLRGPLRVEADFSYYQRGGAAQPAFVTYAAPGFDGVMVGAALQAMLRPSGMFRPYVGGGPVLVSLGNDFVARVQGVDGDIVDLFPFVSWTELDVGLQAVGGVDIVIGRRAFPFIEYRHLFGRFTVGDMKSGVVTYRADQLRYYPSGRAVSQEYDWSGPSVLLGLKVRF